MTADFLVVGSGLAGLVYALEVAQYGQVALLCKSEAQVSNTALAQGGVAAVLSEGDSFEQHVHDTLVAGAGLCKKEVVELLVREAPDCIRYLQELGVPFVRAKNGVPDLHLEGGHSHHRIVHVQDQTGQYLQQTLLTAAKRHPNICFYEQHHAIDLLIARTETAEAICTGVVAWDAEQQKQKIFHAATVLLATGGLGQIYRHTTNPAIATGDGVAMAYRAGAAVANLEFVQFHPTALYSPGYGGTFLISEAVRGAGAELRNHAGDAFLLPLHPLGSLAPRDVVARAIAADLNQTGAPCVYLDLSGIPGKQIRNQFPAIYKTCLGRGIDCTKEHIPVVPAAHYACGGVVTDVNGCTSIARLYAAGEVACTGVHGANRLASNSLLEAVVFAKRAAAHSIKNRRQALSMLTQSTKSLASIYHNKTDKDTELTRLKEELRQRMWQQAGIVRKQQELEHCRSWLENKLADVSAQQQHQNYVQWLELRNMLETSLLVVKAACERKESRGGHFIENPEDKKQEIDTPQMVSPGRGSIESYYATHR